MKNGKINDKITQAFLMALTLAAALPMPELAFAQTGGDLGSTSRLFASSQLSGIPNLIASVCYIIGISMIVGGALKIRQHTEQPSQTPLSHGLTRLGIGGVIAAAPPLTGWVNKTMMVGGSQLGYKTFNNNF